MQRDPHTPDVGAVRSARYNLRRLDTPKSPGGTPKRLKSSPGAGAGLTVRSCSTTGHETTRRCCLAQLIPPPALLIPHSRIHTALHMMHGAANDDAGAAEEVPRRCARQPVSPQQPKGRRRHRHDVAAVAAVVASLPARPVAGMNGGTSKCKQWGQVTWRSMRWSEEAERASAVERRATCCSDVPWSGVVLICRPSDRCS